MYFFAMWMWTSEFWSFTDEECPVFKTDLTKKEWKDRLWRAQQPPVNIEEETDSWKFFYSTSESDFIDAWEWGIQPTLYLTRRLASEAAIVAYNKSQKRRRRLDIRSNSKRSRIQNKSK